jgi:hypothetical protein
MEHTNEFLQGMFAAYMGCDCEITETQYEITTTTKAKSLGVVSERVHFAEAGLFVHFSKLKPILTPLSEITDEHAVEVARIARCRYQSIESIIAAGKELVTIYLDRSSNVSAISWVNIIDYLRSRHYDLGYMHLPSLITAGLAIKKTI